MIAVDQQLSFFDTMWTLAAYLNLYMNWVWYSMYCSFIVPISFSQKTNLSSDNIANLCMQGVETEIFKYWTQPDSFL